MSLADITFKTMCEDVLTNGTDTRGQEVRPIWPDTKEKAYTIKQFGVCNVYDLRTEFPAITFRKTYIKSSIQEILWIYQKKSNNINDLGLHIWDEWANENGSIGKAYGYQIAQRYDHHMMNIEDAEREIAKNKKQYPSFSIGSRHIYLKDTSSKQSERLVKARIRLDQMDAVIWDLKHNPFSRRIMTNMYSFPDLLDMGLQPCAYSTTWNVTDEGGDKLVLNLVVNQRSQDILAANNWNVCQYAALLMMVAQVCDMIPGKMVHMIADAHIYDRHVDIIKELIERPQYDAPTVTMDPDIKNFYQFTKDSFKVENYKTGPQVENIPIAV